METIISEGVVTDDEVRIKGPNAALMQQTTALAARGELADGAKLLNKTESIIGDPYNQFSSCSMALPALKCPF